MKVHIEKDVYITSGLYCNGCQFCRNNEFESITHKKKVCSEYSKYLECDRYGRFIKCEGCLLNLRENLIK